MSLRRPRVFIASTSEALKLARALAALLRPHIDVQVWADGFFSAGDITLEALEVKTAGFDGAIVLATADDRVIFVVERPTRRGTIWCSSSDFSSRCSGDVGPSCWLRKRGQRCLPISPD